MISVNHVVQSARQVGNWYLPNGPHRQLLPGSGDGWRVSFLRHPRDVSQAGWSLQGDGCISTRGSRPRTHALALLGVFCWRATVGNRSERKLGLKCARRLAAIEKRLQADYVRTDETTAQPMSLA